MPRRGHPRRQARLCHPWGKLGGLLPERGGLHRQQAVAAARSGPVRARDRSAKLPLPRRAAATCGAGLANQIKIYFVGTDSGLKQVTSIAARAGGGNVQVIDDAHNILSTSYDPVGLTAILVHNDSAVRSVQRKLIPGFKLKAELGRLAQPGLGKRGHRAAQLRSGWRCTWPS